MSSFNQIPSSINQEISDQTSKYADCAGYQSATYAHSFSEHGILQHLDSCKGWVISRQIPTTSYRDAIGLYPLFCCQNWNSLIRDIKALSNDLVSVCLVPDPFGNYTDDLLKEAFDYVRPYKTRYITELSRSPDKFVSNHHRKYAEKGFKVLDIDVCERPEDHLDEWINLYSHTCQKHRITGMAAFSREAFRLQLSVPGVVMFRAKHNGEPVAIHIWMTNNRVGYGHLAGHRSDVYELNASYALYWYALHWFHNKIDHLDLGSVSGITPNEGDGLSFFKRGWSTETRVSLFCEKVLNADSYTELLQTVPRHQGHYFPAYRTPRIT